MSPLRSRSGGTCSGTTCKPIEQVLAQLAARHRLVGSRLVAAMTRTSVSITAVDPTRLTAVALEHAQQLDLQVERHLGDLVEEQRAAVRALEEAVVLAHRRR